MRKITGKHEAEIKKSYNRIAHKQEAPIARPSEVGAIGVFYIYKIDCRDIASEGN